MKLSPRLLLILGTCCVIQAFPLTRSWAASERSPSSPNSISPVPPSDVAPEYRQLRALLTAQNWQAADQETRRILQQWVHPNGDMYATPTPQTIPVAAIRTLDQLWVTASNGRFGFSTQQRIWQQVLAQYPTDRERAVRAFGDRVGWTRPTPDPEDPIVFLSPVWLLEKELTFSLPAPQGHLPWTGISWEIISGIISEQGCGSCTIDAQYLQGDRFHRYLPGLYERVKLALDTPSLATSSWQQPRLQYVLNLDTLYPRSTCPVHPVTHVISPNSAMVAVSSYSYERYGEGCSDVRDNSTLVVFNAQRGTRMITLVRGQATEALFHNGRLQEPMDIGTEQTAIVGNVAWSVAFTPDSRLLAAGLSDGTIRLWNTQTWRPVRTLSGHRYAVHEIAISADGRLLVSASSDQTIKVWNLQTGQLLHSLTIRRFVAAMPVVHTLLISPDGRRLVSATRDSKLQLWDIESGRLIRTLMEERTASPLLPIAFSPDGRTVATADTDHSVKLWNAETGARMLTLSGHQAEVRSLSFSPDGQILASSSEDNTIRLQHLRPPQRTQVISPISPVGQPYSPIGDVNGGPLTFSPDGRTLVSKITTPPSMELNGPEPQGIQLWDVASGRALTILPGVASFTFSPNNQLLLTNDETIRVWRP